MLSCTLAQFTKDVIKTKGMVDSSGTGIVFMNVSFVQKDKFELDKLPYPQILNVVDGRESSAGSVTHSAIFDLNINNYTETITAFVTELGQNNLILGLPWLTKHNPLWTGKLAPSHSTRLTANNIVS